MPAPLSVEFVNTEYAVRGQLHDAIPQRAQLAGWLGANAAHWPGPATARDLAGIGASELVAFRALRSAVRELFEAAVARRPVADRCLDAVNRAAAQAPRWPVLRRAGGGYAVADATGSAFVTSAFAAIAQDAIRVAGGPLLADLRYCPAPGCVQFFVRDHPRRQWCSATCGNRARVARHQQRHRTPTVAVTVAVAPPGRPLRSE